MRILIVVSTLAHGGAERAAADVSRYLSTKHDVSILMLHDRVHYAHGGDLLNLGLAYRPDAPLRSRPMRVGRKILGLRQAIAKVRPDVVLSFTEGPNLLAVITRVLGSRVPVVLSSQIPPSRLYAGGPYASIFGPLMRSLYRRADAAIALSEGVRSDLVQSYGAPGDRVQVIPNPVDIEWARRMAEAPVSEPPFDSGVPVILGVGRLAQQKNHALILRAFSLILDATDAHVALMGTGPLEQRLRELAEALRVAERVHFLGWQPNPFRFMRKAHALVLSSDFEGFGNVIAEALACGTPVVSTDCPWGPREILGDDRAGLLVPVGDERRLSNAMLRVLTDGGLRESLRLAGEKRVRDFALPVIGGRYESVLASAARGA